MISTEKLINFIKAAKIPDDARKRLIRIVKVADDNGKRQVWRIIVDFEKRAKEIEVMNPRLDVDRQIMLLNDPSKIKGEIYREGEEISVEQDHLGLIEIEKELAGLRV